MHGLLDVDVTEACRLLEGHEPPLSMTGFVIAATARAVAAHPEVHAYRDWRGRLVRHRHVNGQTLVEVQTSKAPSRSCMSSATPTSATSATSAQSCGGSRPIRPRPCRGGRCQAMEEESRVVGSTMKPAWNRDFGQSAATSGHDKTATAAQVTRSIFQRKGPGAAHTWSRRG
jgi:hypothetical protein